MTGFNVGDCVEAVDDYGVWARGTILEVNNDIYRVTFDGYGSMWDADVSAENVRVLTVAEERISNRRLNHPSIVSFFVSLSVKRILIQSYCPVDSPRLHSTTPHESTNNKSNIISILTLVY